MRLSWRITLLGNFCAQHGAESPAHFETRQMAALLTYLAFFRERALHDAAQAGTDTERAVNYCRAITLYTGELLPGRYENWVNAERERLGIAYRHALGQAAGTFTRLGDLPTAISYAKRAIRADSLDEEAHAALIRLYAQAGRPIDAIRQYQELERVLRVEMGLRPAAQTRALMTDLQRLAVTPDSQLAVPRNVVSEMQGAELTDFQTLNAAHLESIDKLFLTLAEMIADQLDLDV